MGQHLWRTSFLIGIFVCLALVIEVFPLPYRAAMFRPELLNLLVIYWVISRPHELGVFFAWCLGLLQDIVGLHVWGSHALALTVIAYICLVSWQRIRSYSVWQQAMWVFVLVGTHQVLVSWIQGLAGYPSPTHLILVSTLISAILWPPLCWLLRRLQRRLRILAIH